MVRCVLCLMFGLFVTHCVSDDRSILSPIQINSSVTKSSHASLSDVLRDFSREIGFSFALDSSSHHKKVASGSFKDFSKRGLKGLLKQNNLGMVKLSEKIYRVFSLDDFYIQADGSVVGKPPKLFNTKIAKFTIKNSSAVNVLPLIEERFKQDIISKRMNVAVDQRTNSIYVGAPNNALLKEIKTILKSKHVL